MSCNSSSGKSKYEIWIFCLCKVIWITTLWCRPFFSFILFFLPSSAGSLWPIWIKERKKPAADLTRGRSQRTHAVMWPDGRPCLGWIVGMCVSWLPGRPEDAFTFCSSAAESDRGEGLNPAGKKNCHLEVSCITLKDLQAVYGPENKLWSKWH